MLPCAYQIIIIIGHEQLDELDVLDNQIVVPRCLYILHYLSIEQSINAKLQD